MRMSLSAIALALVLAIFRRDAFKINLRDLHRFVLLGICGMAGSNFFYYYTIKVTTVATAILLQYMAPIVVLGYAAITRDEELNFAKIAACIISLAGCFLAVGGIHFDIASIDRLGLLSGLGAAVCWSFTNISLRHLLRKYSVWTVLIYAFLAATLFWQFFNPPWKIVEAHYSANTWGVFFVFAMVSVAIPQALYFSGMRFLTPSRAIITASFEPVVAILTAFLFVGESLTLVQSCGAALVIVAIGVLQTKKEPTSEQSAAAGAEIAAP